MWIEGEKVADTTISGETLKATAPASTNSIENGHQRSKSAFVISTIELMDHRRLSRTRSGPL